MATKRKIFNPLPIDFSPFARVNRLLATDPKAWIETSDLMVALDSNAREPIPESVRVHLRRRLDRKAKKRRGRGRTAVGLKMRNVIIATKFEKIESWLNARQARHGLIGWRFIRDADWWQGPPSERAARMVVHDLELNLSWESVRNIAYNVGKNGIAIN